MKVIDVYRQYFAAACVYSGVPRRAALVTLTATSDSGHITYEAGVSFFPHRDEEDYAVSYDACASAVLYDAQGRRAKSREKVFLSEIQSHADRLAASLEGQIFWDQPLRPAQFG